MILYNTFYTLLIISTTLLFVYIHNYKNANRFLILLLLYVYHLFFAYVYYFMSFSNNADSIQYYYHVSNDLEYFNFHFTYGTHFIKNITYVFIKYLDFSYLNMTLLFASFAYFGFYMLFQLLNKVEFGLKKTLIFIFFLPNIHFWTVGIGKDSFIFFALALLVYSLQYKKIIFILISLFLVFLVRPHIAFLIVISFGILTLFYSNIKFYQKVFILLLIALVTVSVMNLLLEYIGLKDIDPTAVGEYIEKRQGYNTAGGSSIDIKEYNFFMKLFSFLYRPLFESGSILSLIVSVENIIYLSMTLYIVKFRKYIKWTDVSIFSIIFIIIFTFLMSNMIANLGIAVRQKTMIIPMFFYLFSIVYYAKRMKNVT